MDAKYDEAIKAFHLMWDAFPGIARLIDEQHNILAANSQAVEAGIAEGKCFMFGPPANHKGCLAPQMLKTKETQVDYPIEGKIRGWMPVAGYDDIYVHFSIALPKK